MSVHVEVEDVEQLLKQAAESPLTASLMLRFNQLLEQYPMPSSYLALRYLALEVEAQLFHDLNDGQRAAIRKFYDGYLLDTLKLVPIGADDQPEPSKKGEQPS